MNTEKAIDLLDNIVLMMFEDDYESDYDTALRMAIDALKAQAERTEERTETHGVCLDAIDRQVAINALHDEIVRRRINEDSNDDGALDEFDTEAILRRLPSAQPEPCVDTIDALDESIKHFDDMAEECRRNANIEQNDYMDMRDDAAEYRQLSIWLNELKWLRERFQSQPEIVQCEDCQHWEQETINDGYCTEMDLRMCDADFYCGYAERKTDEDD